MKKISIGIVATMAVLWGIMHSTEVVAKTLPVKTREIVNGIREKSGVTNIDVSTDWEVINYSSSQGIPVNDVFKLGLEITALNQRIAMSQFANIGNAEFKATKTIMMKAGRTYTMNLVYAQLYNKTGSGYIDFNGDKFLASNNPADQKYTKVFKPEQDEVFIIEVYYQTPVNGNGYFKVGYDMAEGGITEELNKLNAPIVSPAPEASTKTVTGTADAGNEVIVSDSEQTIIGQAKVDQDGKYLVTTTRALNYHEELSVIQKDEDLESEATKVRVEKTTTPQAPVINMLYDDETHVTGTAEPLAKVQIEFSNNPEITYEGIANDEGEFQIELEEAFPGKTKFTGIAIDQAGKHSEETRSEVLFRKELEVTLDNKLTSIDQYISGTTSRPNSEVKIKFGDRVYNTVSDGEGRYSVTLVHNYVAGTKFTITAYHEASESVAELDELVMPRTPNIPTISSGLSKLDGESDPDAKITVTLITQDGEYEYATTADENGLFSIKLLDDDNQVIILEIGDKLIMQARLDALDLNSEIIEVGVLTYMGTLTTK